MKSQIRQAVSATILLMPAFFAGSALTWPSYTIRIFESNSSPIGAGFTHVDKALLGATPIIGTMLGTAVAGNLINTFGRKKTAEFVGFICLISWTVVAFTKDKYFIYLARILPGFGSGICSIIAAGFIGEIADTSIRGAVGTIQPVLYCIGSLFSYVIGWLYSYYTIISLNIVACVIFLLLVLYVRETPSYFSQRSLEKEAIKSMAYYKGRSINSKMDDVIHFNDQLASLPEKSVLTDVPRSASVEIDYKMNTDQFVALLVRAKLEQESCSPWQQLSSSSPLRRALVIVLTIFFLSNSMGSLAIQVNAGWLFRKAVPGISSDLCSIVLALSLLFGTLTASLLSDVAGRRVLMLGGCIFCAISMSSLAILLTWSIQPDWLVPFFIVVFIFFFSVGPGSVPHILLAEYFPDQVRELASSIVMESCWIVTAVFLVVFPVATEYYGISTTFFMFSGVSCISVLVVYLFLPETKGLSPDSIKDMLKDQV